MISFYDLDYIIDINEKRLEQYSNAYQKIIDKFTNLLVFYSAFAIFLVPIVQSLFFAEAKCYWLYHVSFYIFSGLFIISLIHSIRLLMPVKVAHLKEPGFYYKEHRLLYERGKIKRAEGDALLKASYINELEQAVKSSKEILKRKSSFYHIAFSFAVIACVPYLLCVGFQIAIKEDKVQKVEIVNKFSNFDKMHYMAKDSTKKEQVDTISSQLPGVDNSKVIPSKPFYIVEGLQFGLDKIWKALKR